MMASKKAFSWMKVARFAHTPELELGWHKLADYGSVGYSMLFQILVQLDGRSEGVVRYIGARGVTGALMERIGNELVTLGYLARYAPVTSHQCGRSAEVTLSNLLIFPKGSAQEEITTEETTPEIDPPITERDRLQSAPLAECSATEDSVERGISVDGEEKENTAEVPSDSNSDSTYRIDAMIAVWSKEICKLSEVQRKTALKRTYAKLKEGMSLGVYEKWFKNAVKFLTVQKWIKGRNLVNWIEGGLLFTNTMDLEHHFKVNGRGGLPPVDKKFKRPPNVKPDIVINADLDEVTLEKAIKEMDDEMH